MAFSYLAGDNPLVDYVRLLIGDTTDAGHVWEDAEILTAYRIQATGLPSAPISYLRVAALLLDALASNRSRLAVTSLLDANVDPQGAAKALREQAKQWREVDDDTGAFAILSTGGLRRVCGDSANPE